MATEKTINVKNSIAKYFLNANRIDNVISFVLGFIIAHCTDFNCLIESIYKIIGK